MDVLACLAAIRQPEIGLTLIHPRFVFSAHHAQPALRVRSLPGKQLRPQPFAGHRRQAAEDQRAVGPRLAQVLVGCAQLVKDRPELLQIKPSPAGQDQPLAPSLKQLQVGLAFKLAKLLADRPWRDGEHPSGLLDAAGAGHRFEDLDGPQRRQFVGRVGRLQGHGAGFEQIKRGRQRLSLAFLNQNASALAGWRPGV